jgi:hypothetical protein
MRIVPPGLGIGLHANPGLPPWAKLSRAYGAALCTWAKLFRAYGARCPRYRLASFRAGLSYAAPTELIGVMNIVRALALKFSGLSL